MLSAPVCRQAGWLNAECKTFTRLHVRTLARWKWELGTGNWEFLFSVFYFLFPVSLSFFMHVYKVVSWKVCKLTRWKWKLGISVFRFLFS